MAVAIDYEASKTIKTDQVGVYQVIRNRMLQRHLTACEVIKEPKQFSFVKKNTKWVATREQMIKLRAAEQAPLIFGPNVLYYHAKYVKPKWADKMALVCTIGTHRYYRKTKVKRTKT